jgi:hypothetical protein
LRPFQQTQTKFGPHVDREASILLQQRDMADRTRIEAGSFFERFPIGADAYVLTTRPPRLEAGAVLHHPRPLPVCRVVAAACF